MPKLKADLKICMKCPNYQDGNRATMNWAGFTQCIEGHIALCNLKDTHPSILMHTMPIAHSMTGSASGPYIYNENFIVPRKCPYRLEFIIK